MKRDLNLMRSILLRIEEKSEVPPKVLIIEDFLDLCNDPQLLSLQISLLLDAGFIEVMDTHYDGRVKDYDISRLTFSGYEYLDAIRDPSVWKNIKDKLKEVGGSATLDVVKALGVSYVKSKLHL